MAKKKSYVGFPGSDDLWVVFAVVVGAIVYGLLTLT